MTPDSYPPLLDTLGRGRPTKLHRVGGGCIADARVAAFADGSRVFVKCAAGRPGMFEREAEGLRALAGAGALRVPEVLAVASGALVLELIEQGSPGADFFGDFGRAFARLHASRGRCCGFPHDNFIGSTPQHNEPLDGPWETAAPDDGSGWPAFFLERRLRFQVELAAARGAAEPGALLRRAASRILDLLAEAVEPPSLLHGDLWGGNYMVDENGAACLIDPAAYYGHREADLAMTRLFGGFRPEFYRAYQAESPLTPGHQDRLPIYQLYHVLNHFNLFGGGYLGQSVRILQRLAR